MRNLSLVLFLLLGCSIQAASVDWGCFILVNIDGRPTIGYDGSMAFTDTSISLKTSRSGASLSVKDSGYTSLISFATWTIAVAGEIVSHKMFEDPNRLYLHKNGIATGDSLLTNYANSSFIMAFETVVWEEPEFYTVAGTDYGWVEVNVKNGVLSIGASALGLDGVAMLAGAGAVPEPTSAVLVLFGLSGLALRRRKGAGV